MAVENEIYQRKFENEFQFTTSRISSSGILVLTSSKSRSQVANKETVIEKFYDLLVKAFAPEAERIPTKPLKSAKEIRLKDKKMDSLKKDRRKKPTDDELQLNYINRNI